MITQSYKRHFRLFTNIQLSSSSTIRRTMSFYLCTWWAQLCPVKNMGWEVLLRLYVNLLLEVMF